MTAFPNSTILRRKPRPGAPSTLKRTTIDRHNSQFIHKLAADVINSNPYRYALTRDGRLVESKLPAAVQVDLSSQLQRKLRQPPPDEPKTAAQADSLSVVGHRQRVPRRPSIGKMIAQAEKATSKPVTSITLPDGTKLDFGGPAPAETENPWLADLPKATKQ